MYNSSTNNFNPFEDTNQTTAATSSFLDTHHQNPSSIQQHPSPSPSSPFLNFPIAPFLYNDDFLLNEILTQHNHQQQPIIGSDEMSLEAAETNYNQEDQMNPAASKKATTTNINKKKKRSNTNASSKQQQPMIPRKRSGKKDRHSKIFTAQGPRDRRMRLSLQIARKFFDLQDMLGFDKASKTIDWLFTKSKTAIKELTDSLPKVKKRSSDSDGGSRRSVSSTSESEVMSGIKLTTTDNNRDNRGMGTENDPFRQIRCQKSSHKPVFDLLARDSREKARARARERTKEKLKNKGLDKSSKDSCSQSNLKNLENLLGPSSSLENSEKQDMKSSSKLVGSQEEEEDKKEEEAEAKDREVSTYFQLPHQMDSTSIVDKFMGLTSAAKSSSIFDLYQNVVTSSGPDFEDHDFSVLQGNWDPIMSNGRSVLQNNRYNFSVPNMKLSPIGNNAHHVQNPNAFFMESSNSQRQNLTSLFMSTSNTQEQNPDSVFMNLSNPNHQNPSPSPMTSTIDTGLHSHFVDAQFSCNPINAATEYSNLY